MIQTIDAQRSLSFSDFLTYNFPDEGRYELVNGDIVRILATRQHDILPSSSLMPLKQK